MNRKASTRPSLRPFRATPFGSFTLLAPLGAGGMGEIFLARATFQGGLDRFCVIKRILPHLAKDPDFVTRFLDEVRTLLQLQHGSIAQVYDAGAFGDDYWIALELVDGKDVRRLLQRLRTLGERLPLELALYVAIKVLEALAYAHRKKDDTGREIGLVHRDVSPQNILLSYEGEVKVIDFGLAESRVTVAKNPAQMVLGKLHYMAPEQGRGEKVDRRSDLYAVGVVLWEMLVGKNPFEETDPEALLQRITDPRLPPIQAADPSIPSTVAAVVDRALSQEPFRRFATAEEMRSRLSACLSERAPDVGPEALGKWLVQLFDEEHERERELFAKLASRDDETPYDPGGETQVVQVAKPFSRAASSLDSPTEFFHLAGPVRLDATLIGWGPDLAAALQGAPPLAREVGANEPSSEEAADEGDPSSEGERSGAAQVHGEEPVLVGAEEQGEEEPSGGAKADGEEPALVDTEEQGEEPPSGIAKAPGEVPTLVDTEEQGEEPPSGNTEGPGEEPALVYTGEQGGEERSGGAVEHDPGPVSSGAAREGAAKGTTPAHPAEDLARAWSQEAQDLDETPAFDVPADDSTPSDEIDGGSPSTLPWAEHPFLPAESSGPKPGPARVRKRRVPLALSLLAAAPLLLLASWLATRSKPPPKPEAELVLPALEAPLEPEAPVEDPIQEEELPMGDGLPVEEEERPAPEAKAEEAPTLFVPRQTARPKAQEVVVELPVENEEPDLAREQQRLRQGWDELGRRLGRLVELHGEERVGSIVVEMKRALDTSMNRFIDEPGEYGKLESQLRALGSIVKEREDALH